jgi:hypothetical protein
MPREAPALVRSVSSAIAAVVMLLDPRSAVAQPAPPVMPITDGRFALDLRPGPVFGSTRVVAMGGASTALTEGATGLLGNPGASALRPSGATDHVDWDGTLGGFSPNFGSDFDNNGVAETRAAGVQVGTAGLLGYLGDWALGLGVGWVEYEVRGAAPTMTTAPSPGMTSTPDAASVSPLQLQSSIGRLSLARTLRDDAVAIGVALRFGAFDLWQEERGDLMTVAGAAAEGGFVHTPRRGDLRWGARVSLPVHATDVKTRCENRLDCLGHVLPEGASAPWEVAVGIAWRLAPTPWRDGRHGPRFRDERAVTLAADAVLIGPLPRGAGVEAFAVHKLQPSGRAASVSLHAGAEAEVIPGWLRLQAGSYVEPARVDGARARLHGTLGAEVRVFAFHLFGIERRLALAGSLDAAPRYGSGGVSLGFWH